MSVPNPFIEEQKLTKYLLDPSTGKGAYFADRYGKEELRAALLEHAQGPTVETKPSGHGALYVIEAPMRGDMVRSVWIDEVNRERLVTAYPIF